MQLENQIFRIEDELYTLLNRRGNGKFGSVWTSITSDGYQAAVKVLDLRSYQNNLNPSKILTSFKNEVKMMNIMRDAHDYVVTLYGSAIDLQRGLAFISMELGNDSLRDRVANLHQMHRKSARVGYDYISIRDRINVWIQLVDIILALYQYDIIHRDIKPNNLIFFGPRLKVIDLGIAQTRSTGHFRRQIRNRSAFSAPECSTGEAPITPKADIWSIGAILYYLTYGRSPLQLSSRAPVGIRPTRSTRVQDILDRCLQRNLYQRPTHHWLSVHPLTKGTPAF
ncbi:hypothetical protein I4U23_015699 [Adineta vaga]|nr:hypothetical protein I4U23_015699 [Adineta vaga]